MAVVIVALDTTVLNVAIPTILREFDTSLGSVQWVITGYTLTFASLLIIGGRLGDLFGHRRMFIIGAAMFGIGSLIAALSQNVAQLLIGEAVIEGMGAALMMPATLAILSNSFVGHERAKAFGVWGAVGGASGALGPVVGGVLTSNWSWRWSFGINVIVVPIAITGALLFMPKVTANSTANGRRESLDLKGAILVASGVFLLVFGLSDGAGYGWFEPNRDFTILGAKVWPATMPVSVVPVAFAVAVVALAAFVKVERRKERRQEGPLFEFGQLRHRGFRYGLIVTVVMSLGQFGLSFVLPIFLQEGRRLSAQENGLWMLPTGLFVLVGAQVGGRLVGRLGALVIIRAGLLSAVGAFIYVGTVMSPDITFWKLAPGLVLYGLGFGLSLAQLTNIVLSDVDRDKSGAAGGANNTARQVGFSIGIAVVGSLLTSRTIAGAVSRFGAADDVSADVHEQAIRSIRESGVSFVAPERATPDEVATLQHAFVDALASGAQAPLLFSAVAVTIAFLISLLLPRPPSDHVVPTHDSALAGEELGV